MCSLFAKAGTEGALLAVRASFIDTTNLCLKNIHTHLLKVSTNFLLHCSDLLTLSQMTNFRN